MIPDNEAAYLPTRAILVAVTIALLTLTTTVIGILINHLTATRGELHHLSERVARLETKAEQIERREVRR